MFAAMDEEEKLLHGLFLNLNSDRSSVSKLKLGSTLDPKTPRSVLEEVQERGNCVPAGGVTGTAIRMSERTKLFEAAAGDSTLSALSIFFPSNEAFVAYELRE